MKVKGLKPFICAGVGDGQPGKEYDVPAEVAQSLIEAGAVEAVEKAESKVAKKTAKKASKK